MGRKAKDECTHLNDFAAALHREEHVKKKPKKTEIHFSSILNCSKMGFTHVENNLLSEGSLGVNSFH